MEKRFLYFILIFGLTGYAGSCPPASETASSQKKASSAPIQKPPYVIIQHKLSVVGGELPTWVGQEFDELESQPQYKEKYVFKIESPEAKDLEGAKLIAKKMDATDQIASMVKQRIQTQFAGSQVGDKNKVETYFESVVKVLGDAKITGFRQEKDFWVQIQYTKSDGVPDPDRIVYRYWILYSIPKTMLDNQLKKAFETIDGQDPPKTEDQITARNRVKEVFQGGF